ncbi:MAG: hypothetical protein HFI99_10750 [Lachnospiraceae bacterium]|jgi:hypothetical protein|nr:hypothetical protein [Lachnospiraceae bacterium]
MEKSKFIFKGMIFLGILGCTAYILSPVLTRKYEYKTDYAAMEIARGFYAEPADTLDVLYLGSSYMRNGISPLEIWHDYGITGYARTGSQQAPIVSYYLLKEAFQTQSPKVVVYEASFLISTQTSEANNYDVRENRLREAIDFMKLSSIKTELAKEIVEHSSLSYADLLLPFYRYHERWTDLGEIDFQALDAVPYAYKGQYPALTISAYEIRENYMAEGGCDEPAALDTTTAYYVERMQELCRENDAELILVHMPNTIWDDNRYRIISGYAQSQEIIFLDYCTDRLRSEIGFNPKTDSGDGGAHLNIVGAEKVSRHLGNYLRERFHLEDKRSNETYAGWNKDYVMYTHEKLAKEVVKETNLSDFLDLINQSDYLILVTGKSDTGLYFTNEIYRKMQKLGFKENLAEKFYSSYIGAVQRGECIYEKMDADEAVSYGFSYNGHYISMMSEARRGANSSCSIQIDGKEESNNAAGLNFVIYDTALDRIITAKRFNTGNTGYIYTEKRQFPKNISMEELLQETLTDRYMVVLSVKCDADLEYPEEKQEILESYGVKADVSKPYIAVWDGGELVCQKTDIKEGAISMENSFSEISVRAVSSNTLSKVWLNREEITLKETGCNFVIYDKYTNRIAGVFGYRLTDSAKE